MRPVTGLLASLLLLQSVAAVAGSRKVVEPLDPAVVANLQVVGTEVSVSDTAKENWAKFEAKAAEKRAEAGLPPWEFAGPDTPEVKGERPARTAYSTLPFRQMFALTMEDVTKEWGLTTGTPVNLKVSFDTVKTANAGMAMLAGSADQLAGLVEVSDAASGKPLGSFYIDVINSHSGLMGLAMRGSGIREELAEEFALESSRVLAGRKSKKPKAKS
jgi:hypothetical protein